MSRTGAFASDFCNRMKELRASKHDWKCGDNLSGRGHEAIDVIGRPKKGTKGTLVLVEIELRRDAPLTNVVKVWRWLNEKASTDHFLFIQAFSRYYKKGDTKRKNAELVGRLLEEATGNRYLSMSFPYNPYKYGKEGAGRRRHHARLLAERIQRKVKVLV